MFKKKKELETIMSPQDEKNSQTEREKKLEQKIKQEVENEFYANANLSRLFADMEPAGGILQYAPIVGTALSLITLVVLLLK